MLRAEASPEATAQPMSHWSIRANGDDGMTTISHQGRVDEIVIGSWFHFEQMDRLLVCIGVGDVGLTVQLRPARRPIVNVVRGSDARGSTSVDPPAYPRPSPSRVEEIHSLQAAISRLRASASPQRLFILPAHGIVDRASFLGALSLLLAPTEPPAEDWQAMRGGLVAAIDACGATELVLVWPSAFELSSRDRESYRIARGMFEEAFAVAAAAGSRVVICTGRDDGVG